MSHFHWTESRSAALQDQLDSANPLGLDVPSSWCAYCGGLQCDCHSLRFAPETESSALAQIETVDAEHIRDALADFGIVLSAIEIVVHGARPRVDA
jgi:hypothetical protein